MRLFLALCLCLAVPVAAMSALLALALAVDGGAGTGNLIVNGDFADADVSAWGVVGGTLAVTVDHVGALTLTSSIARLQQ